MPAISFLDLENVGKNLAIALSSSLRGIVIVLNSPPPVAALHAHSIIASQSVYARGDVVTEKSGSENRGTTEISPGLSL
ncbi:hypothetical protein MesoLjLb_33150 [Mesorhizobium sp. L-8-3]|nr:hypothetical protein MesoLjLb_33150 [Mesorhizobium sp. L-8-3]